MLRHLKGSCYQRVKQVSSLYTNMCEKGVPERSSDELVTTGDRTKLELMVFQLIFSQIRFLPALPLLTYPIFVQVTQLCHLYAHYTIYLWKYKKESAWPRFRWRGELCLLPGLLLSVSFPLAAHVALQPTRVSSDWQFPKGPDILYSQDSFIFLKPSKLFPDIC